MDFFKKLFKDKDKKVIYNLLIFLSAGIALLIAGTIMLRQEPPESGQNYAPPVIESGYDESSGHERLYEKELEERLAEVLSLVDGAGAVKVMLTLATGYERVVAVNTTTDESSLSESDANGGTREQSSAKNTESVLIVRENGNELPFTLTENPPKVEGMIIVAEGGGDIVVKDALMRAASAALGVDMHKISVLKMK